MMDQTTLLIAVAVWCICGVGSYMVAAQKGDPSPAVWGLIGFILGPVGLLLAMFMSAPARKPPA